MCIAYRLARKHADLLPKRSLQCYLQPWHRTPEQTHPAADEAGWILRTNCLQRMRHGAGAERALVTDREPLALECALRSAAASGIAGVATTVQHDGLSKAVHPPLQIEVQLLRVLPKMSSPRTHSQDAQPVRLLGSARGAWR